MLNPFCQVPTKFELSKFCVTLCCADVTMVTPSLHSDVGRLEVLSTVYLNPFGQ